MGKGVADRQPLLIICARRRFYGLFFGIIAATGTVFARSAGNFNAVKTTVAAVRVVSAIFHVAFNRIVSVHNTLLFYYYALKFKVLYLKTKPLPPYP